MVISSIFFVFFLFFFLLKLFITPDFIMVYANSEYMGKFLNDFYEQSFVLKMKLQRRTRLCRTFERASFSLEKKISYQKMMLFFWTTVYARKLILKIISQSNLMKNSNFFIVIISSYLFPFSFIFFFIYPFQAKYYIFGST